MSKIKCQVSLRRRVETQSHSPRVSLKRVKEGSGDTVPQSQSRSKNSYTPSADHIMGLWDCVSIHFTTHPQLTISWDHDSTHFADNIFCKALIIPFRRYLLIEKNIRKKTGCIIYLFRIEAVISSRRCAAAYTSLIV